MTDREYEKLIKKVKKKREEYHRKRIIDEQIRKNEEMVEDLKGLHSIDIVAELEKTLVDQIKIYKKMK